MLIISAVLLMRNSPISTSTAATVVWRRIYKQFIQNNEDLDAFLEEKSLYWNDDKDIIDTFIEDYQAFRPGG